MLGVRYIQTPNVHIHLCTNDVVCLSGFCRSGKYHEFTVGKQNLEDYNNGSLIQDAFPGLTASEREFILTGMCCDPIWDLDDEDDTTCPF